MQKIGILTDSACDLSFETLQKYPNIKVAPLRIIYSDKDYEDKVDITPDVVYNSLDKEIPKTSLPSTQTIEKLIQQFIEEDYTHIIAITISEGLSGTYNAIRLALENYPQLTSTVFNTKILSVPEGLQVIEAANLIETGKSFDEVTKSLENIRDRSFAYYTVDTLKYLKKGGRIGKVAGTVGELLNLKPIISLDKDGVYYTACKVRGRKQSHSKLIELLKTHLEKSKCIVNVLHGNSIDDAKELIDSIKGLPNVLDLNICQIGPALVVHTGPGLIGLAIHQVN